jgi:2-(1,2-epoxy-1,2-dihydrophenyl)acetyl-CoA isomerase
MADHLLISLDTGILTLTLNYPEKGNALSQSMQRALVSAARDAAMDPGVRVVLLRGAGKMFCSGGDVNSFGKADPNDPMAVKYFDNPVWTSVEQRTERTVRLAETAVLMHRMGKPTIAMLHGAVAGAGLSLAAACDFRIASASTRFTTAFSKIGASGDWGGSYFVTKLVGASKARELYFFSDKVEADEAYRIGLVNRVVAEDKLEEETMALAQRLASGPSIAYRNIKQNINAAETQTLEEVMDIEGRNMTRSLMTEDSKEAVAAFLAKRAPVFKGL